MRKNFLLPYWLILIILIGGIISGTGIVIIAFNIIMFDFFSKEPSDVAYAYIDPGSIAVLLQVIIAGIVGALAVFRNYIISLFKNCLKLVKKNKRGSKNS